MQSKITIGILIIFILLSIFCFNTTNPEMTQDPIMPNFIDGFTSASTSEDETNTIRVDSGVAYDTFAVLFTFYKDSHDEHFLAYGKDSLSLFDTVSVANWPRDSFYVIPDLEPNTSYIICFRGQFSGNPEEENATAWGKFETTYLSSHY